MGVTLDVDLPGKRIVVTRAARQAASLIQLLEAQGAEVIAFPTIEIAPPESWDAADDALARLEDFDWIAFTSANAVDAFLDRARELDAPMGRLPRIAAVGGATLERLADAGVSVDLRPDRSSAVDLALALIALEKGRILIPRAAEVPSDMRDALTGGGWDVLEVPVYRTVTPAPGSSAQVDRLQAGGFDIVTFTSGSSVRGFVSLIGGPERLTLQPGAAGGKVTACLGPRTAAAAKSAGFEVHVVAEEQTAEGLVSALTAWDH
jgi:uroporphyrinogen III methyltransferase/synthase